MAESLQAQTILDPIPPPGSRVAGMMPQFVPGEIKTFDPITEGSGGAMAGAFFTQYTDAAGDIYLQGGTVSGGTGNILVDGFKLYDLETTTWVGTPGMVLALQITGNGQTTSGILDPIYNVTAASVPTVVGLLPNNTLPVSGSVGGKFCHISLGTFFNGGFGPANVGNIRVGFCWGGYSVSRDQ